MTSSDSGSTPEPPATPKPPAKDPWDLPDVSGLVVGVLGGTGDQGRGLAYRLGRAGQKVIVGSRAADRAAAAAAELGYGVEGADNLVDIVRTFRPGPDARLGVLLDHLDRRRRVADAHAEVLAADRAPGFPDRGPDECRFHPDHD